MASVNKKHFCSDCKKGWVRSNDYNYHFLKAQVKDGGRLVPNPCFQRKRQASCKTLSEASCVKKSKIMDMFKGGRSTISDLIKVFPLNHAR